MLDEARYKIFNLDTKDVPLFIAYTKLVNDNYKHINAHSQFSVSVTHGDFRGENVFFPEHAKEETVVIDFQLVKEASPLTDISYLMIGSMTPEERRKGEVEIIRAYYEQCKQS